MQVFIPESQIRQLCIRAREIFTSQPVLLEVDGPIVICGDIHGQYPDLLRHFDKNGYPPQSNYLFLGDYVDRCYIRSFPLQILSDTAIHRGKQSIEAICLLLAHKVKYPENLFLLRGNHECASINRCTMLLLLISLLSTVSLALYQDLWVL